MDIQPVRDRRPLAVQVYDQLYDTLIAGDESLVTLPPEQELAKKLAVSRTTVRQALALLEEDGILERGAGRRRQVAHRAPMPVGAVRPLEQMVQSPEDISVEHVLRRVSPATGWSARLLEIDRGTPIATWESTLRVGEVTAASALEVVEATHEPSTVDDSTMFALLSPHYRKTATLSSLRLSPYIATTRRWPHSDAPRTPVTVTFTTRSPDGPIYLAKHVVDLHEVPLDVLMGPGGEFVDEVP